MRTLVEDGIEVTAPRGTSGERKVHARAQITLAPVATLVATRGQSNLSRQIGQQLEEHPDAAIITSLPSSAPSASSGSWPEIGTPADGSDPEALSCLAGPPDQCRVATCAAGSRSVRT
jgi:hypothetical protein